MNVRDLMKFAHDANTSADVSIVPHGKGGVCVRWEWKGATYRVGITEGMLSEDRWPHFSIRACITRAADFMAQHGGTPDRKSPLFMPATEVLDYQRQKELLDMKLASGIIPLQQYVDALVVLLTRRHKDNALWFGANRNG